MSLITPLLAFVFQKSYFEAYSTINFMSTLNTTHSRVTSIDMLRGIVMVLMALDHVRDYFHYDAFFFDPTDLSQTSPALFLTRFVTHFCAPVFVFLAGTSAFFVGQKRDKKSLSTWLLKRGIWLIIAEFTIIKFAWYFQLDFTDNLLQVIWILGFSMICLAGFIHVPKKLMIVISLIVIFGHNAFDSFAPTGTVTAPLWALLHQFNLIFLGKAVFFVGYPIIPWIFVMPLGYHFGELYLPSVDSDFRIKKLLKIGLTLTILFFVIRGVNLYGDPYIWSSQKSLSFTIMSFFNISKYPPSLIYLLITLGPSIIFLSYAEKWQGSFSMKLVTIGRVPMFYYIVHIYAIHLLATVAAVMTGFSASDMVISKWVTMHTPLQGYGFDLWVTYVIWIGLIIALYPLCSWYDSYKSNNRDKWWLSYL